MKASHVTDNFSFLFEFSESLELAGSPDANHKQLPGLVNACANIENMKLNETIKK